MNRIKTKEEREKERNLKLVEYAVLSKKPPLRPYIVRGKMAQVVLCLDLETMKKINEMTALSVISRADFLRILIREGLKHWDGTILTDEKIKEIKGDYDA